VEEEVEERAPTQAAEAAPGNTLEPSQALEPDLVDNEPMPTSDPTAELLGTTKRKRASRSPVQGAARGGRPAARKPVARKTVPASRRGSRPKKDALEKSGA
jgi:hypothetical protein